MQQRWLSGSLQEGYILHTVSWKKYCAAVLLVILLMSAVSVSTEAASYGVYYRPAVTFITTNAPSDMVMRVDFDCDKEPVPVFLYREDRLWESYFRLYRQTASTARRWYGNRADFKNAVIVVMTGGREIQVPLPEGALEKLTMNDFFMLDVSDFSLQMGLPLRRSVPLFFLRLAITTSAAMLVLHLFRYRWKRSWVGALVVNLVCQGALSLFVANRVNFNAKLLIVYFVIIVTVLVIQIPFLWRLLDENDSQVSFSYSLWSNVATGLLNFMILIYFPL